MSRVVITREDANERFEKALEFLSSDRFMKWFTWTSEFLIFGAVGLSVFYLESYMSQRQFWSFAHFTGVWFWLPWALGFVALSFLWNFRKALIDSNTTDLLQAANISIGRENKKRYVDQLRAYLFTTPFAAEIKRRWEMKVDDRKPLYWTHVWRRPIYDIGITFDAIGGGIQKLADPNHNLSMLFELQQIDPEKNLGRKLLHMFHPELDLVLDLSKFLLPAAGFFWIFHALAYIFGIV